MNPWSLYSARRSVQGTDRRSAILEREKRHLARMVPNTLSYHTLSVNGETRSMAVINTDNLNIKTLCSMPNEDIPHGGMIEWRENHWLVMSKDANNELYTKATMQQCNYLLKWVDDENNVIQKWCIIEDSTKYLTGEWENTRAYVVTRGDTRVYMYIQRDKDTVKLNRQSRFLIDDSGSIPPLAYRLTKPFKLGGTFNEQGILSFVLLECQTEDTDNFELMIPNYYDHYPRPEQESAQEQQPTTASGGGSWL